MWRKKNVFRRFMKTILYYFKFCLINRGPSILKKGTWPGGSGQMAARSSHRPVRAFLMHTVPQIMDSLRDDTPSGPPAPVEAGSAPTAG